MAATATRLTHAAIGRKVVDSVKANKHAFTAPEFLIGDDDQPTNGKFVIMYIPHGKKHLVFHCTKQDGIVTVRNMLEQNVHWTFEQSNIGWSVHSPLEDAGGYVKGSEMHDYILKPVLKAMA